jgi:hypothetical protein
LILKLNMKFILPYIFVKLFTCCIYDFYIELLFFRTLGIGLNRATIGTSTLRTSSRVNLNFNVNWLTNYSSCPRIVVTLPISSSLKHLSLSLPNAPLSILNTYLFISLSSLFFVHPSFLPLSLRVQSQSDK